MFAVRPTNPKSITIAGRRRTADSIRCSSCSLTSSASLTTGTSRAWAGSAFRRPTSQSRRWWTRTRTQWRPVGVLEMSSSGTIVSATSPVKISRPASAKRCSTISPLETWTRCGQHPRTETTCGRSGPETCSAARATRGARGLRRSSSLSENEWAATLSPKPTAQRHWRFRKRARRTPQLSEGSPAVTPRRLRRRSSSGCERVKHGSWAMVQPAAWRVEQ